MTTVTNIWEIVPLWITAAGALVGMFVAFIQLGKIRKTLDLAVKKQKLNALQVVLEIETQMNARKVEFDRAARQLREAEPKGDASAPNIEVLADWFNSMKENYFNALDRLAFCILNGYLNERDWRAEYRSLFQDTVRTYEQDFLEASPYRSVKKLNQKWQES